MVKNWLRSKNTLEYLGLWEQLNNPHFKGVEFDPLLKEAGSNAFTMSPTRWVELTNAVDMYVLLHHVALPNFQHVVLTIIHPRVNIDGEIYTLNITATKSNSNERIR